MFVVGATTPTRGSLLGDIDSSRTMVIYTTLDMSGQIALHGPICKVYRPKKRYVDLAFRYHSWLRHGD